jgi:DNA-binding NtrC family response regulator
MSTTPRILVVDDDPGVVAWLVDALPEEGFDVVEEVSTQAAIAWLDRSRFDVVVSDVEMPEMRGLEFLRAIRRAHPRQLVLLITAFGSIDLAVEALKDGAADFLAKPFRIESLAHALRRALRERTLRHEIVRLRAAASRTTASGVISKSDAMSRVVERAHRAARSALPVLITGESGVGKGALAMEIHRASERRGQRFVHLNCAALPASLAEAELFGVRRGAFTDARESRPGVFEQAHGGTLFLDEVGDLPLEVQPKLLQALESSRVRPLGATDEVPANVRIVAATNRPLEESLNERRFRPDLYHRLNVVRIEIPPLRERVDDIDALVDHVLASVASRGGTEPLGITVAGLRWLRAQAWPGNVRELINAVERACALTDHDVLDVVDFRSDERGKSAVVFDPSFNDDLSLADLERVYLRRVLARTGGHKANASKILGLDRRTLYRKVAELEGKDSTNSDYPAPGDTEA